MGHVRNVGRVGALAVALGVSAAVSNPPAVGWAQPSDSGSTPSQTTSDRSDSTGTPSAADRSSKGESGGSDGADAPQTESNSAPETPEDLPAKPRADKPTNADDSQTDSDVDAPGEAEFDSPAVDDAAASSAHHNAAPPTKRHKDSATTDKDVKPGHPAADSPAPHDASADADSPAPDKHPAAQSNPAQITALAAQSLTAPDTAEVSTTALIASQPRNVLTEFTNVVVQVAAQVVSTVLGPLLGPDTSGPPGSSPLLWAVLAWARRELDHTPSTAASATTAPAIIPASGLAAASTAAPVVKGSFPMSLINNTGGVYSDDQIYMTLIGQVTPGTWSWIDSAGVAHALDHTAADAKGHLVKDKVNYANMSFTLAQAKELRIPPTFQAARMYVSLGQPLYIRIDKNNQGWAGPDPMNPSDPNYKTAFDWYEMTYSNGKVAFGGNTTQVDQFALPMKVTLKQTSTGFSETRGIRLTRDQVFARYAQTVPSEFQALVVKDAAGKPLRIVAPRTTQPGALATWMDKPVNDFWTTYAHEPFTYNGPGYTVKGHVNASGQFAYTLTSGGVTTAYTMRKPTTQQVFANDGPFVGVGRQGAFLAELAAAFNRGVANTPTQWDKPAAYYPAGQRWNAYAKFFHAIGVENRAYGFPYDDVNSQSSVQILGNAQSPTKLNIYIG